jgi:hypothetical protein
MVVKRGTVANSQTLHGLRAVTIDTRRQLVLIKGNLPNEAPVTVTVHRRVLSALIGSLIQAETTFPKSDGAAGLRSQPLKLGGAAVIALDDGEGEFGIELVLSEGLLLRVIVPREAIKPLGLCIEALVTRSGG